MIELLSIDVSNYCSKQCPFCYNHSSRKGNVLWTSGEVISFASDCVSNGVKSVSLGGGEPFEYEGVFDVIDALRKITYLSVTSNGLPLSDSEIWHQLNEHKPDKIHISIHDAGNTAEVDRALDLMKKLSGIGIKPGINLLVPASKVDKCRAVYRRLLEEITAEQIILIPQKYTDCPEPEMLSHISGGQPFQSPSCLLGCRRPGNFASVSWDKKVCNCSYAPAKQPLKELTFRGMMDALNKVQWKSCHYSLPRVTV